MNDPRTEESACERGLQAAVNPPDEQAVHMPVGETGPAGFLQMFLAALRGPRRRVAVRVRPR